MFVRSPLHAWVNNPEHYYRSVTAHGTVMAYVFPTLVAMGFGYAITELALKRPLVGVRWAWAGFWLVVAGAVMAMVPVALGRASVLYTFYPPMIGSPFYYIGVVLVVVGSWIWVALMSINLRAWRKANPGEPVPLAMFGNVAGAYLWAWTSVGAALEVLLPDPARGARPERHHRRRTGARVLLLDAARHRLFLADADVHRLLHHRAARDRRPAVQRHDGPGRLRPVPGVLDADRHPPPLRRPAGRRRLQVRPCGDDRDGGGADPAHGVHDLRLGRDRGAPARRRGPFGWIKALPWDNPIMLAVTFSFVMLGFGGAGGIINMSYQLNETIHNTQWVTGHFHLIFGGAIVIMYFVIAYDLWPHLTGRALPDLRPGQGAALARGSSA